jgi:hypothetical protein
MIFIEYLNAQIQVGRKSYAIIASIPKNTNPAVNIYRNSGLYYWDFKGIPLGEKEIISGTPRSNHLDVYFGMDDLVVQRNLFPNTRAHSIGLSSLGLRNPLKNIRKGGKPINWKGPLGRIEIEYIEMIIPPYKVLMNKQSKIILNLDREFAKYNIQNGNGSTRRELHLGVEHDYNINKNKVVKIPRIRLGMSSKQYATVLEGVDLAIKIHRY